MTVVAVSVLMTVPVTVTVSMAVAMTVPVAMPVVMAVTVEYLAHCEIYGKADCSCDHHDLSVNLDREEETVNCLVDQPDSQAPD